MRIKLKVAGLLGAHLPPGSRDDEAEIEVGEGATPLAVMEQLGMPLDESYLVVVNDTVVPRAERARRQLAEGDNLVVMPPLRGG